MDLGNEQQMNENLSAAGGGAGGSQNQTGGDGDDIYQSFIQSSQPRGLSAIERAVQNTVQNTKNYLSQPVNQRGIFGSLLGGALFGPFGALLGGSLGQRFGGTIQNTIKNTFTDGPGLYGNTIPFTNPRFDKQFTMPMYKPDIPFLTDGGIKDFKYSPEIEGLMANKPDYKVGDISDKTFDAAIGSGFNPYTGEELQPGEAQELQDQRNQSNLGIGSFIV